MIPAWIKPLAPLALVALCLAVVLGHGASRWKAGYTAGRSEGEVALERLRLEQARAAETEAKANAKALVDEQARHDRIATELATQQRQHRTTTDRLSGEIARVNDLYRDALDAPPQPLPACLFTRGFVRVWDEASGARMPAAADPGRTAAQGAEARALEQLDAGLDRERLLAHHVRYAEQCRNTAAQLDALIDAIREQRP